MKTQKSFKLHVMMTLLMSGHALTANTPPSMSVAGHNSNQPERNSMLSEAKSCNNLGGLAVSSEENSDNDMIIKHATGQCCAHFASCKIGCEVGKELA